MQILNNFCLVSMFLVLFGAENISLAAGGPILKDVRLSGPGSDAQHLEIIADAPLTYTYYRMPDLFKVVVDLALVDPGPVGPLLTGSGLVSKVTVDKKELATFSLTRVAIDLQSDADFTVHPDAGDRSRLLVTLRAKKGSQPTENAVETSGEEASSTGSGSAAEQGAAPSDAAPAAAPLPAPATSPVPSVSPPIHSQGVPATPPAPAAAKQAPPAQLKTASIPVPKPVLVPVVPVPTPSRTISDIRVNKNLIEITASSRLDDYKAFTLVNPARLVIDIPMSKTPLAAKEISLKRFGLSRARIGNYPDKVRMVFDADGNSFPTFRIDRKEKGLAIFFPGKIAR